MEPTQLKKLEKAQPTNDNKYLILIIMIIIIIYKIAEEGFGYLLS